MLYQITEYFTPTRLIQNILAYFMFSTIAYHKVLLGKLGVSSMESGSTAAATQDFWHQPFIERAGFAFIWGTMGMLAVAFIWLVVNGINEFKNARSLTRDYANVKDDSNAIYKETAKRIAAGFSPLIVFPISMSWLLPLTYRLLGDLVDGPTATSVIKALASLVLGTATISLLGASIKLMRTAFA